MALLDKIKLIVSETLASPSSNSYVTRIGNKNVVLRKQGNYQGLDLSNLDLEGAHLEGVNLENAILRNTNLTGAHLDGANLKGADLTGTILAGTHLKNAMIDPESVKAARIDVQPIGLDFSILNQSEELK